VRQHQQRKRLGYRFQSQIGGKSLGEARLKKSATAKFISQYPQCALCGGDRASTTREHMPPKSLFDNSHRPDKLVMPACHPCNNGTSKADLTAAMVSRWNYHSSQQERDVRHRLGQSTLEVLQQNQGALLRRATSFRARHRLTKPLFSGNNSTIQ
jgi:hypothetical protein